MINIIKQFFLKFKFKEPQIYLCSDLHLGHTNIIKYCNRPFKNVKEMNRILIKNWNSTVSKKDTVYFLGDLAFGKGNKKTDPWLKKLNGKILFIKGNHDKSKTIDFKLNYVLKYNDEHFYLVHYPHQIPSKTWNGWVICGHTHNNHLKNHPFINGKTKQINVSTELLNYKPLNIKRLFELNYKKIEYMKYENSKPVYFKK